MSIPKNILLINTFETFVIFSEKKFDENSQLFRRSHAKLTIEKKIHRNASRYSDDSSSESIYSATSFPGLSPGNEVVYSVHWIYMMTPVLH